MGINIQNLLNVVQAKLNATTPTTPALEFSRLSSVSDMLDDHAAGVKSYPGLATFPTADSANHGDIAYSLDSGAYRISEQLAWREISLNADSVIAAASTSTQAQGSTSGYTSGGGPNPNPGAWNIIDKFPFSSDGNATDVGDLSVARYGGAGQSSTASGYTSAGGYFAPPFIRTNVIDKFPFSSDGNATDVGDLTAGKNGMGGQSSTASGYNSGGYIATPSLSAINVIDKFPFSSDANATDVGDLSVTRNAGTGQSSSASGYTSGGNNPLSNVIDKFPFASDGNATDVGDITEAKYSVAGQSSSASGYTSGGNAPPNAPLSNVIDKFPFSSDANATDVGDMTATKSNLAPQSSTASGYNSGGNIATDVIEKFPFSSDANATDVGDLTVARWSGAGQQV